MTQLLYTPIGDMRQQITLLDIGTRNGDGTFGAAITFAAGVWAKFEGLTGKETYKAQQIISNVSCVFFIRYLTGAITRMTVSWNSKTFQILGVVDPDGMQVEMRLYCVERDDGQ
jgi:SPP1 family predicted phage head-tail adaptor